MTREADAARVLERLEALGLLLLQDPKLPSVATIIAGEPIRGSWWGHAAGGRIFHALGELEDRDDVLFCRLVAKKVTLVHGRRLPALCAIGAAREAWQMQALSREARALFERVEREGPVRASGAAAKELELRLLCAGQSVHTESGKHVTELASFEHVARARKLGRLPAVARAKAELEALASALEDPPRLPWLSSVKRARARSSA
jgi:hypothetical protein